MLFFKIYLFYGLGREKKKQIMRSIYWYFNDLLLYIKSIKYGNIEMHKLTPLTDALRVRLSLNNCFIHT